MSVRPNSSHHHETRGTTTSSEPHIARRTVRYAATTNAQSAMIRQFPQLFVTPLAQAAMQQTQTGARDDSAQAA